MDDSDLRDAIKPKSDQLNSDDLISGPRTIRITRVVKMQSGEQRVHIYFEGDDGKPWKPCITMTRVLVEAWGPDSKQFVGRSVTLYRNPKVKWAGLEVGGIELSHLSHIERDFVTAVTVTKGKRKGHLVKVLQDAPPAPKQSPKPAGTQAASKVDQMVIHLLSSITGASDIDSLLLFLGEERTREQLGYLKSKQSAHFERVDAAIKQRRDELGEVRTPGSDDE